MDALHCYEREALGHPCEALREILETADLWALSAAARACGEAGLHGEKQAVDDIIAVLLKAGAGQRTTP